MTYSITQKDREELSRWNQKQSPLVSFARSLRMEGSAASNDSPKDDDGPSLLKDLDLDNIPDRERELLQARDTEFKTLQTKLQEAEAKTQQALKDAQNHQSRADKLHGALKAHNLDPDSRPAGLKAEETAFDTFKLELIQDGMKPEQADGWAKIMAKALPTIQNSINKNMAQSLAPFVETIGDMKVDQLLSDARSEQNDPEGIFQIPDVAKNITENLKYLTSTGTPITAATIESIKALEYGKHVMKNPTERRPVLQQLSTRLQGRIGGSHVPAPRRSDGAPMAVNDDTARAAETTITKMLEGIKRN